MESCFKTQCHQFYEKFVRFSTKLILCKKWPSSADHFCQVFAQRTQLIRSLCPDVPGCVGRWADFPTLSLFQSGARTLEVLQIERFARNEGKAQPGIAKDRPT